MRLHLVRFEKCDLYIIFPFSVFFVSKSFSAGFSPEQSATLNEDLLKFYSEKPTNTTRLLNTSSLFVEVRHFDNFYFVYFSVAKNFSEKLSKGKKTKNRLFDGGGNYVVG